MTFDFEHKCGILLAVSSLPSSYGIGHFGKPCYKFIDFLAETKQKCWQVLPLCPTSYGDSPYQSPSSFAGNPYFVDLDDLHEQRLLTNAELKSAKVRCQNVNYGQLFDTRYTLLKKAFSRFVPNESYFDFCKKQSDWLEPYALFMALKEKHNFSEWQNWGRYKYYENALKDQALLKNETEFWKFVQYEFFSEWKKVLDYAHGKGIEIIGDMPIYASFDSVDVWSAPCNFCLDENLQPTVVAGCPPDGFSEDGQLWGNPVYNWAKMEQDGFTWWLCRIKHALQTYDYLRIDHFRGFAGYFVINYGEKTAKFGHWERGVGKSLFSAVKNSLPSAKIIAEDLGFLTDDVRELLFFCGFPGMKVLQFAFDDYESEYLPRNYPTSNCIVYTGTHDSECTATWAQNLCGQRLANFVKNCPRKTGESKTVAMIDLALSSKACLAVIPLQDYLEKTDEARMNTPSTSANNWCWRASPRFATKALKRKIIALVERNGR